MSKVTTTFTHLKHEVEAATRACLIDVIRLKPEWTIETLIDMVQEYPAILNISVGEILGKTKTGHRRKHKRARPSQAVEARAVDTRSRAGRQKYDEEIFSLLVATPTWVNAQWIRARLGGTPEQARRALNRLIDEKGIRWKGKARATRYSA